MNVLDMEIQITDHIPEAITGTPLEVAYDRATFRDLDAEIESSKSILSLPDNWDGEGRPRYSQDKLDRAIAFVRTHTGLLVETFGKEPPVPRINPGPEGSIDIHWKLPSWELLVNVPSDTNQRAAFYGDDYGKGATGSRSAASAASFTAR